MKACEPLRLSRSLLEALSREASASGHEVVGFLLGVGCRALVVFPMENVASSSVEFLANPLDVVAAHNLAEALGLELIALYHSHPFGPAAPSSKDLEGMKWWPMTWLIVSAQGARAWRLAEGKAAEVPIELVA